MKPETLSKKACVGVLFYFRFALTFCLGLEID